MDTDDDRQKGLKKRLQKLLRDPGNVYCADCRIPNPTWTSKNIGVFLCMNCAGVHRSLGTHITEVRSVTIDRWEEAWVQTMTRNGNKIVNASYEARLPASKRINPSVDSSRRAAFIR